MNFTLFPDYLIASGNSSTYNVLVQKKPKRDIGHNPQLDPEGSRMPPRRIPISISLSDGLSIPDIDKDEIELYEVLDENGMYLAMFTTEQEFISFIFTLKTTVEFRIYFEEYILQGYLNIL